MKTDKNIKYFIKEGMKVSTTVLVTDVYIQTTLKENV